MDPLTDRGEIAAAWRALDSAPTEGQGWKTIRVAAGGPFQLRAGRHFPGSEEALLIGFREIRLPRAEQLPAGGGFTVMEAELGQDAAGQTWIGLCRQTSGSRELFGVMAEDVAGMLRASAADKEAMIFQAFLARIRAWQEFMLRGSDGVLGPEAEVGLFGELEVLRAIVGAGATSHLAVSSWAGPLDGVHDFSIGNGGIEVKSTIAVGAFPARIGSLEQLDHNLVKPLFLACVRLELAQPGATLGNAVHMTRALLDSDPVARQLFDSRLLHVGYLDSMANRYTRTFRPVRFRLLEVTDGVPRLTRGNVPQGITKAQYEIDIDSINQPDVSLADALKNLGAIT
ncbi:MAG TPA: PD-(D/E)XK motif protein [Nevskia sp.]|nr:PD-(D/E)XK motif protein [Nevskia sp.]